MGRGDGSRPHPARYSRIAAQLVISIAARLGADGWQGYYRRDIDRRPGLRALLRKYERGSAEADPAASSGTADPFEQFRIDLEK